MYDVLPSNVTASSWVVPCSVQKQKANPMILVVGSCFKRLVREPCEITGAIKLTINVTYN